MRVIHLISGGDSGGAKTHVLTLLEELKNRIDIQLVCLTGGPFYDEAIELGINAIVLEQKSRFDLSVNKKLADLIMNTQADVLHCHGARANFISTFIKKKIGIPVITTVHSDYKQDFSHSLYKKIIFTSLNKYGLNRMDYYLVVTSVFKQVLKEQGFDSSRAFTIYNGIKIIDEPVVKPQELVFGCVTRLVPIKGTHILLEAVKKCIDQGYRPKVRIAGHGTGHYVDELYDYVKEHKLDDAVDFIGFSKDINQFFETITVNILPSYTEGMPYSLLEGGIRSKGTIASKTGGIVEMIEDRLSGRLFEVANSDELASIMIELMNNPELAYEYGENFRTKVINEFSDTVMAQRHVDIYEKIVFKK